MIYHRNKNNNAKRTAWMGVVIALFLVLTIFSSSFGRIISVPLVAIGRPFFEMNNSFGEWLRESAVIIKSKAGLEKENTELNEKISEMRAKNLSYEIIKKENKELKSLLSRVEKDEFVVSAILSRPPQSPYDTLVVDAGSDNGIEEGMQVTAYGNILLGYVTEVFSKTSKIKLISFANEETNVLIIGSKGLGLSDDGAEAESEVVGVRQVSAIATGKGGGNLEVVLPRGVEVNSGDRVATLGINSLLVGVVEETQVDLADPFQKIFLRLPLNLQKLNYILIKTK